MVKSDILLLVLPVFCTVGLACFVILFTTHMSPLHGVNPYSFSESLSTNNTDDDDCSCQLRFSCTVENSPVLGGVDFVQYFTTFKLDDGSYNETNVGLVGSEYFNSTWNNYLYYFLSQDNKDTFDSSPEGFIPQYGGFCGWGISSEYCPNFPWDVSCLGPPGNWGHWTILNDKLYFFFEDSVKLAFVEDSSLYIDQGDTRWESWFAASSTSTVIMNTNCYQPQNRSAS